MDIWDLFQQAQIGQALETASSARRDVHQTDAKLHTETQRLEEKIGRLALICQALIEVLEERGGLQQSDVEKKIEEIDLRDGRADGRITGRPMPCSKCGRPGHTRNRVCMYCGAPFDGSHLSERL